MRLPDTKRLQAGLLAGAVAACLALPGAAHAEDAVTTAPLNVRAGPGTAYAALAALPPGTPVDVETCSSGWCRVRFRGGVGYVSQTYLDMDGGPPVVTAPPPPRVYREYDPGWDYAPGYGYGGYYGGYYGPGYYRPGWGPRPGWRPPPGGGGLPPIQRPGGGWQGRPGGGPPIQRPPGGGWQGRPGGGLPPIQRPGGWGGAPGGGTPQMRPPGGGGMRPGMRAPGGQIITR